VLSDTSFSSKLKPRAVTAATASTNMHTTRDFVFMAMSEALAVDETNLEALLI
jgi:hypothetical protein